MAEAEGSEATEKIKVLIALAVPEVGARGLHERLVSFDQLQEGCEPRIEVAPVVSDVLVAFEVNCLLKCNQLPRTSRPHCVLPPVLPPLPRDNALEQFRSPHRAATAL